VFAKKVSCISLQALEGFLFVVSSEGKVEFVTDNVGQFTRFSKDDVLGKSIYNFLHHGDHARFSSGLLPMAIGELILIITPIIIRSQYIRFLH
jgi:nuclear receptor coactivator 2